MNTKTFDSSTLEKAVEVIKKYQPDILTLKETLGDKPVKEFRPVRLKK